jgi:hypothetical protein
MKHLIVSTPKTGNTWLKNLLAHVYDLPIKSVKMNFDPAEFDALGPRWVCHQHLQPSAGLISWARANGAVLFTTVRHPADAFVSVFHYARDFRADPKLKEAIQKDGGRFGDEVAHYAERVYPLIVNLSLAWMHTGLVHVVRYEDLWADPVGVLAKLTRQVRPVPDKAIEAAVAACNIQVMREKADAAVKNFFRKGGTGGWREALPPRFIRIFMESEPYPRQLAALGYQVEEAPEPAPAPPPAARGERAPEPSGEGPPLPGVAAVADWFRTFSGGASLDSPAGMRLRGAFTAWLNEPSDRYPGDPPLSNLAVQFYQTRPDLREAFPDLRGPARVNFLLWFLRAAPDEHKLDRAFVLPALEGFRRWACHVPARPGGDGTPPLCNLALHIYHTAPQLPQAFPDLSGKSAGSYLLWFWVHVQKEFAFDPELLAQVGATFKDWAVTPARPEAGADGITLDRFLAAVYDSRPDVQARYPVRPGEPPVEFLRWFFRSAESAYGFDASLIDDAFGGFCRWANRSARADPHRGQRTPLVTNFGAYLHATHPERERLFPDLYDEHRIDFAIWFVHWVSIHEPRGWDLALPVLQSWATRPAPTGPVAEALPAQLK